MLYEFTDNDILDYVLEASPDYRFLIYNKTLYHNYKNIISGTFSNNILGGIPSGYIDLFENNINKNPDLFSYPYVIKDSSEEFLSSISSDDYVSMYEVGDIISGSYPKSASISIFHYTSSTSDNYIECQDRKFIRSLRNTFDDYSIYSPHYFYSSSYGEKILQECCLVDIPSVLFGSKIKKGSVFLRCYITGTLVAELNDTRQNGELLQTYGTGSGSVAGVVLYNHGFIFLSGTWGLGHIDDYGYCPDAYEDNPRDLSWCLWGTSLYNDVTSASFTLDYKGVTPIPVKTMFCHLPKGRCNYSNNPTFLEEDRTLVVTDNHILEQGGSVTNMLSSSFHETTEEYKKTVFINRVAIYDDNKKILGYINLANPIRKTQDRNIIIKTKIDF